MRYANLFDFWLTKVNNKYSPWDQDQIGIKSGADPIINRKLVNVMYKKGYPC